MCDVVLASLMAPSNLPALGRPAVVLIATRHEDWPILESHPMVAAVRDFAEVRPLWMDAPACPGETGSMAFARGQCLILAEAQRAGAVCAIGPADKLWADGALPRLVELARPGRRMVVAPGFRMSEEGIAPILGIGKGVISVSPRQLAALSIEHMHSQYRTWEADHLSCGDDGPGGPWWRAAPDGIVVHSLNWEPVMVDFSHGWPHDLDPLRRWTIDGHYAWWNCVDPEHWHAVTDSDDHLFASPTAESAHHVEPLPTRVGVVEGFRKIRSHQGVDPLRQKLAALPFLIHGSDLDDSWNDTLERARAVVIQGFVVPRERWHLQEEMSGYQFVSRGVYRDVVLVHGRAYSIPIGDGPLDSRIFRDGVQPHGRLEDALAACPSR